MAEKSSFMGKNRVSREKSNEFPSTRKKEPELLLSWPQGGIAALVSLTFVYRKSYKF